MTLLNTCIPSDLWFGCIGLLFLTGISCFVEKGIYHVSACVVLVHSFIFIYFCSFGRAGAVFLSCFFTSIPNFDNCLCYLFIIMRLFVHLLFYCFINTVPPVLTGLAQLN